MRSYMHDVIIRHDNTNSRGSYRRWAESMVADLEVDRR